MHRFLLLSLTLLLLLCACNDNKEPDLEIELPINAVFLPISVEINTTAIGQEERLEILNLVNNNHIVNDISDLPIDPIGQYHAFQNINFNEHTLLIKYIFVRWNFDTYSNLFYRNTKENSYNWIVRVGILGEYDDDTDDNYELVKLTRFAILVKKLPVDADVITWFSKTQL